MSIKKKYASFVLPAESLLNYNTGLVSAREAMAILPEEETATVKRLAKIGNRSESFAREAHALGKNNLGLLPRDLDLANMERTLENRDVLRDRLITAKELVEKLEAAIVLLGVDAYRDGLDVYHALKRGGTNQTLREAVRELGRTFRKSMGEAVPTPTEPETPEANS